MGFKEILEAKKLAAAKLDSPPIHNVAQAVMANPAQEIKTIAEPVKKEEDSVTPGKPLSFQEKMALKKQTLPVSFEKTDVAKQQAAISIPVAAPAAPIVSIPAQVDTSTPVVQQLPSEIALSALDLEKVEFLSELNPTVGVGQAYADIKVRIDNLINMSETELGSAMSELKRALMANPSAVELMLDSDYGQMVVALRRLVQEDAIEATKDKKEGKKSKKIDLTDAAQVEAVFNEL